MPLLCALITRVQALFGFLGDSLDFALCCFAHRLLMCFRMRGMQFFMHYCAYEALRAVWFLDDVAALFLLDELFVYFYRTRSIIGLAK